MLYHLTRKSVYHCRPGSVGDDKDVFSDLDVEGHGALGLKEEYVLSELDVEGCGVLEPGGETTA